MKTFSKIVLSMVLGVSALSASEPEGTPEGAPQGTIVLDYLALDNGYRWDKISNHVTLGGNTVPVRGSTQLARKINSYQLGARGQWSFCDAAFVRGSGHYGWIWDGKYSEGGLFGDTKGHTSDFSVAVGYYFCLTPYVWVAPVAGWAYDALNLHGTDITTAINGVVYDLRDINAKQQFNGPFIGFDLVYQIDDCYDFTFGYEFHYATWHGKRQIQGKDYGNPPFGTTTGFSNDRHMDDVYGNVFKLDATYQFCNCWIVGLGLKYQFFNGDFGHYRQTKEPIISQFSYANVDGLWWRSFASTIYVGTKF